MAVIHYLGPVGTFSEQAAQSLGDDMLAQFSVKPSESQFGGFSFVPQPTISRAIAAIDGPDVFAVVPYYNLIEGLIQETPDLIIERKLEVLAARQIPIRLAIGGFVPECAEVPVYSHPKALAQSSIFLQAHFPAVTICEISSTSQAVHQVLKHGIGLAIARREALESQGVPVLHDDIGNRQYARQNYTEFLLVGQPNDKRVFVPRPSPLCRTRTLIAIIPVIDRVGLLADILGQIAFFGINLLKIHSRPALGDDYGPAPQMFYLETDMAADSPELRLCIETLDMRLAKHDKGENSPPRKVVRVLGTYLLHTSE